MLLLLPKSFAALWAVLCTYLLEVSSSLSTYCCDAAAGGTVRRDGAAAAGFSSLFPHVPVKEGLEPPCARMVLSWWEFNVSYTYSSYGALQSAWISVEIRGLPQSCLKMSWKAVSTQLLQLLHTESLSSSQDPFVRSTIRSFTKLFDGILSIPSAQGTWSACRMWLQESVFQTIYIRDSTLRG